MAHIPCIIGLILGIYGGTKLESDESKALEFLKASVILFLITLLLLVAVAGLTWPLFSGIGSSRGMLEGENKLYLAVLAAIPFLAVRTVYAILVDFEDNATFGLLDGNAYVQLGMAVIEEMVITFMFLCVGFLVPRMRGQVKGGVAGILLCKRRFNERVTL